MENKFYQILKEDEILSPIIDEFQLFESKISSDFFGNRASYKSFLIQVKDRACLKEIKKKDIPIRITYPFFQSFSKQIHQIIHELWHFWQDRHGILFSPPIIQGETLPILDEESEINLLLTCEAMAQIETIRASYRLREKNIHSPWNGGLAIKEWRPLLEIYDTEMKFNDNHDRASIICLQKFYKNKISEFYIEQAILNHNYLKNNFKSNIEHSLDFEDIFNHNPYIPYYLKTNNLHFKTIKKENHSKIEIINTLKYIFN